MRTCGWIDWSSLVESALRVRHKRFAVDDEAVLLGVGGISDFDGLHSGKFDDEVPLYAFDCLMDDGDDAAVVKPLSSAWSGCWRGARTASL